MLPLSKLFSGKPLLFESSAIITRDPMLLVVLTKLTNSSLDPMLVVSLPTSSLVHICELQFHTVSLSEVANHPLKIAESMSNEGFCVNQKDSFQFQTFFVSRGDGELHPFIEVEFSGELSLLLDGLRLLDGLLGHE